MKELEASYNLIEVRVVKGIASYPYLVGIEIEGDDTRDMCNLAAHHDLQTFSAHPAVQGKIGDFPGFVSGRAATCASDHFETR